MGLKWIDTFMGDRTTCGHHRVQVQTGVWEMATCSAADSSSRCTEISWGRALCLSLISYVLPHTSSLPWGSLILPPWGQIGISVSSSSFSPNLMSLFEVSPLTELVVPEPSLCHCTKKSLFAKDGPWYFVLLGATDERISSFMG